MEHLLMEGLHLQHLVCWEIIQTGDRYPTGLFSFISYIYSLKIDMIEMGKCIRMAIRIPMVLIHLQIWTSCYKMKLQTKPDTY